MNVGLARKAKEQLADLNTADGLGNIVQIIRGAQHHDTARIVGIQIKDTSDGVNAIIARGAADMDLVADCKLIQAPVTAAADDAVAAGIFLERQSWILGHAHRIED